MRHNRRWCAPGIDLLQKKINSVTVEWWCRTLFRRQCAKWARAQRHCVRFSLFQCFGVCFFSVYSLARHSISLLWLGRFQTRAKRVGEREYDKLPLVERKRKQIRSRCFPYLLLYARKWYRVRGRCGLLLLFIKYEATTRRLYLE